jgi:hypothetical protein
MRQLSQLARSFGPFVSSGMNAASVHTWLKSAGKWMKEFPWLRLIKGAYWLMRTHATTTTEMAEGKTHAYAAAWSQEHPQQHGSFLPNGLIWVVFHQGETGRIPKWLYLKCPCGCECVCFLPVNSDQSPTWTFDAEKVTISPSVNARGFPCKSHFFITDGYVRWV